MKTMNVTITRRSRNIGFGYTSVCIEKWNESQTQSHLVVAPVETPCYTGTISTIQKSISEDLTLKTYENGTAYRTAWFVKVNGKWLRMLNRYEDNGQNDYNIDRLFSEFPNQQAVVTVEVPENGVSASAAAAALGSISTPRKAAAARENGKRGGRPRKTA